MDQHGSSEGDAMDNKRFAAALDKRFAAALALALAAVNSTAGCQVQPGGSADTGTSDGAENLVSLSGTLRDYVVGAIPDARDIEVARDLGCPDSEIEEMQREGMGESAAMKVSQAEAFLDHLSEKYGLEFRAIGIAPPEITDRNWRFSAEVAEGELLGTEVTCTYCWYYSDDPYFEDDFVSQARAGELEELAWGVVREVFEGREAGGVADVRASKMSLRDEYTLETSVEELASVARTLIDLYFPPDTSLNEREYRQALAELKEEYERRGIYTWLSAVRVLDPEGRLKSGATFDLATAQELANNRNEGVDWDWEVYFTTPGIWASESDAMGGE